MRHVDEMTAFDVTDIGKTPLQRRKIAREWLHGWQRERLSIMREEKTAHSGFGDKVTLVAYTFPRDAADFDFIEFAIRQSWHCLGMLKVVIVADRETDFIKRFADTYPHDVDVQQEATLVPGSIASMSHDCVTKLHTRFTTPYCLIIQDDGFPIRDNLYEFLGKYDYIGSPVVRDTPLQHLVDIFRIECLNGGFSLRSRKICQEAANQWNRYWRHVLRPGDRLHIEDVFYTKTACLNPFYRFRNRIASCKDARRFSMPDFDGVVDIRNCRRKPFGVHGPTAVFQLHEFIEKTTQAGGRGHGIK